MSDVTTGATRETLDSYVTDMLALEQHIQTAIAGQIADLDDSSQFKSALVGMHLAFEARVSALEALTQSREQNVGGLSKVVKKAVSSVIGAGAAAIDFVRTEKLPKNLRDDYTAISLAYIGYVMLYTSALTFDDAEVAAMAKSHSMQHADSITTLQTIIPQATVAELVSQGAIADHGIFAKVREAVEQAWA